MFVLRKPIRGLAYGAFSAVLALSAAGVSAASASTSAKTKPLSMTNVTLTSGNTPVNGPTFVAIQGGMFKKYGLNVSWLNTSQSGALAATTALLAGSAQFAVDGVATQVAAVENGAPIRVLSIDGTGGVQQLAISKSSAAAHKIPATGGTNESQAKAIAQFKALKGSHLNIAVSSLTSNAVYWFVGAAKHYGIIIGDNKSDGDVYFTPVGTPANEAAALLSGKVDGLINTPPITTQPNSVILPYYKLDPLEHVATNYLATTITMIQQHPDTVQAVTTAYAAAVAYTHTHRSAAQKIVTQVLTSTAGTDPNVAIEEFNLNYPTWINVYPSKSTFQDSVKLFNLSLTKPFNVPYTTFVVTHFAKTAAETLHLSIPS